MASAHWRKIQSKLKDLGFDPGPIDGAFGQKTKAAVRAYQKSIQITADGIVGNQTYYQLFGIRLQRGHSVMKAAELIKLAYSLNRRRRGVTDKTLATDHNLTVTKRGSIRGAEAYMLSNNWLLIPGSNSLADYLMYNLRLWNIGKTQLSLSSDETEEGESTTVWHQGFFTHANEVRKWVGDDRADWPKLIIGHSLGAASAQILSKTWAVPAIGFAAPRPRKSRGTIQYDHLSLSICRNDDVVTKLPTGFHRMGYTKTLYPRPEDSGLKHKMETYIDGLQHYEEKLGAAYVWKP